MPKKKVSRKPKRIPYTQLKAMAEELASCVLWALKFCKVPGSGLHVSGVNTGHVKAKAWEEVFMDALDKTGYVIDRKKFWAKRNGRRA